MTRVPRLRATRCSSLARLAYALALASVESQAAVSQHLKLVTFIPDFMPHGYCFFWNPTVLWLHVVSDSLIALSYYFIPILLVYFVRKNRDIPFNRIFWMFGCFILACGTTHVFEVWNIWHASYLLAGIIKAVTAAVSVLTAAMLVPLIPKVMSLPKLFHLQEMNERLARQIEERKRFDAPVETALKRRVAAGFVFALILTIAIGSFSWYSASRAEHDAYWIAHTHAEMEGIERADRHLIEAVTSSRAFALTGEEALLARYSASRNLVDHDIDELRRLVADNPSQQQRLEVLNAEVASALGFADLLITKRRTSGDHPGPREALAAEKYLDAVRASSSGMTEEERRLLSDRTERTESGRAMARTVAALGIFLPAVLWILARIVVNREIHISERARSQLNVLNAELEHRVVERTSALQSEIAERRQSEQVREWLAAVVDSSDDAIISKDLNGIINAWNRGAEKVFGYTAQEAIGRPMVMLFPPELVGDDQEILTRIAGGESVEHFETVRVRKDGTRIDVSVAISPVRNADGTIIGASKIARDITERKQAEKALRESEERFQTMANCLPQLAWIAGADGHISWYNQRWYEYTGTTPAQMEMAGWQSVHDPDEWPRVLEAWSTAIAAGQPVEMESSLRGANGSFRIFLTRVVPVKDADGLASRWFGTSTDVSVLKEAQREAAAQAMELAVSRKVLEEQARVLELAPVLVRDMNDRIVFWPQGAERLYGMTPAESLHAVSHQLLRAEFPAPIEQIHRELFANGRWEGELKHRRSDGRVIFVSSLWVLYRDAQGEPSQILEVNTDITGRKQAEERLATQAEELSRQTEELARSQRDLEAKTRMLQLVLDNMGEGLVAANREGHFILCNDAANQLVGRTASELPSAAWSLHYETLMPDGVTPYPSDQHPLARALLGEASRAEMVILHSEASIKKCVEASGRPMYDAEGNICGGVVAFRDVTERNAAEEQVRKLNQELEVRVIERTAELQAANHELEAFTYSVSHDLRAPLRHMSGFTRILQEDFGPSIPAEAQQYLNRIEQGARRMGVLVDELLSLTRLGRQSLNIQLTALEPIVKDVIALLEPETEGRKIEWRIGALSSVECDAILIRQVFQNLIGNALKYSRRKACAVIEIGHGTKDGASVIFVKDNGVGFSMKYADKLFGVFQRLHRAEDFEGTGVGLATVARIIQKHGGRVWADGELDKGATFSFTVSGFEQATGKAVGIAGGRS